MTLRIISYGGGVQSTAMVVMAALRRPAFEEAMGGQVDAALFGNVGDDSEHPATLKYVREVAIPWATEQGLPVHELKRQRRDGTEETLWERLHRAERSIGIPVRMSNGAPGNRQCTHDFKIAVVLRWLREHGVTKDDPAVVAIGISTDEMERASNKRPHPIELPVYPLLSAGVMMNRNHCLSMIRSAGLPEPGKSSCYFCPFHRPQVWSEMRRDEPELFWKSVELEQMINKKRDTLGKDHVWLTRFNKPLDEAIGEAQDQLPGFESIGETGCDEGYCFT